MSAHVLLNLLNELGKTVIVSFFYFLCFICCLLPDLWRDLQEKDCIIQHNQ